jgi:hypothetical protein
LARASVRNMPLDHLLDVGLALAQVVVLHLVELPRQHLQLGRQRPLGVVVALGDPLFGGACQRAVVMQQHQVHVEQRDQLGRAHRQAGRLERDQFGRHLVARRAQAARSRRTPDPGSTK